jgi:hypothetical protein
MNFASQGNWEEKIFSILETKVDIYFLFQDGSKIDEEFFDKITEKISNLFEEMQEKAENLGDEDQSVGYLLNEEFENLLQTLISEEGYDNSQAEIIRAIFEARLKEEKNDTACGDLIQLSAKGWVAFKDSAGDNMINLVNIIVFILII